MKTQCASRSPVRSPVFRFAGLLAGCTVVAAMLPAWAATGTLTHGQRLYYPQGCLHNGNTAVCSFVFINQGQVTTLESNLGWGGSELAGIRFVDNGNVPHAPSAAYFVDRFGTRQPRLVMQQGGQGTFVLEFPDVNPQVVSGSFHLSPQVVGGIAVTTPPPVNVGPPVSNPTPVFAGQPAPMQPQVQPTINPQQTMGVGQQPVGMGPPMAAAAPVGCVPQSGQTGLCNTVNRVNNAQTKVANAADQASAAVTTVTQTATMVNQLKGALSGFWPSKAQPAPVAQVQQVQQVQPAQAAQPEAAK